MSRFDKLVADRFEQAENEGRLNRNNSREVAEFYNWLRERLHRNYGGRSDYESIRAEIEDAIDFHQTSLNLSDGYQEQHGHLARRAAHGIKRGIEKADKSYESVWGFGSKVVKLGILVASAGAAIMVGVWFFWSNEASLPKLQRAALENTACRPLSKDQCDSLVSAIERTKSSFAITAANSGDLQPAEKAIQANARKVEGDPNASGGTKAQAAADSAIVALAISRLEAEMKRTADGVDKLGRTADTLKRETSDDPRKELQNLGIPWTSDEYAGVIMRCDVRGIRLFRQSGMKMLAQSAQPILEATKNVSCLEEVRDELATFREEACFRDRMSIPFTFAFKQPDHRAFIESLCGEARLREKYPILYGDKPKGPLTGLSAEIAAKVPLTLSDEDVKTERERLKLLFPGAANPQPATQSAPSAAIPATSPPAPSAPAEPALAPNYIRANMLSRAVHHGKAIYMYYPDGRLEVSPDGTNVLTGSYRIESDGRVCWNTSQLGRNCFEYYRRGATLRVRRADANNRNDIGAVTLAQPASR